MCKDLERCLGQTVEIIHIDRQGVISQRTIKLQLTHDDCVKAYCFTKHASRTFAIENILSVVPVVNLRAI